MRKWFSGLLMGFCLLSLMGGCGPKKLEAATGVPRQFESVAKGYAALLANPATPVFITPDLAFERTHAYFADALEVAEDEALGPALGTVLTDLKQANATALKSEKNPETLEVLRHNQEYLQTALCLIGKEPGPPEGPVAAELALVAEAKQATASPVMGYKEDYTQYVPRGTYTKSAVRQQYFRTIMWLGRMGFYSEPNQAGLIDAALAERLTAQGAALALLAAQTPKMSEELSKFNQKLTLWLGECDDLTLDEVGPLLHRAVGKPFPGAVEAKENTSETTNEIQMGDVTGKAGITAVRAILEKEARRPRLLSTFAEEGRLHPPLSIRLVGQRLLVDSYVFQSFTFDKVSAYSGPEKDKPFTLSVTRDGRKVRGVPRAYDLMAQLKSSEAFQELFGAGDLDYVGYREQLRKMESELPDLLASPTFYNRYLKAVSANLTGEHYGDSGSRVRLVSSVGAWALIRHDVVAYAKQSYTSVGRGLMIDSGSAAPQLPQLRVAPAESVFRQLREAVAELIRTFETGKPNRQLVAGQQLVEILSLLERNAGKGALNQADAASLANVLKIWSDGSSQVLVTDVHTDALSNEVLEVGVGPCRAVAINLPGKEPGGPAQGITFSVYEFRQPLAQRLTDEAWQDLMKKKPESIRELTVGPQR